MARITNRWLADAPVNTLKGSVSGAVEDLTPTQVRAMFGLPHYQVVADLTERDAIPAAERTEMMQAAVQSTGLIYWLMGGTANANWQVVPWMEDTAYDGLLLGDGSYLLLGDDNPFEPVEVVLDGLLLGDSSQMILGNGNYLEPVEV